MSKSNYTGRGVSLSGEMQTAVDKRIAELNPWVKGFSAYVQRLIYLDLTHNVIADDGGVNEDAVKPQAKGNKRPFEQRPPQRRETAVSSASPAVCLQAQIAV